MFEHLKYHLQKRTTLREEEFELITKKIVVKQFKKKSIIVSAGEIHQYQSYINKGCVRMFYSDEKGHEHVVQLGFEDWWTGDISSFVTGQPGDYTIEALEDTELFLFDRCDMEWLYANVPKLERSFRILIQNALIALQHRMIASMSRSAEQRYIELTEKFPQLELRVAQHHIASYLGITPEALSRIKKNLILKEKR